MLKKSLPFIVLLLLASCSAKWIKKDANNNQGVVSYLNDGAEFIIKSRRSDALKKIDEFCKNKYEILEEVTKAKNSGSFYNSLAFSFPISSDYIYLVFGCKN